MKSTLFSIAQFECDLTVTAPELNLCCALETGPSISAGSNWVLYSSFESKHFLLILSFRLKDLD